MISALVLAALAPQVLAQDAESLKLKAKSRAMALYHAASAGATAAEALEKSAGKKKEAAVEPCGDCVVDIAAAYERSHRENRFLFVWVGGCVETIRREFPGAVHLSVPSWEESGRKRLVVPTTLGAYVWDESRQHAAPQAVIGELRSIVGARASAPPAATSKAIVAPQVQWIQARACAS